MRMNVSLAPQLRADIAEAGTKYNGTVVSGGRLPRIPANMRRTAEYLPR